MKAEAPLQFHILSFEGPDGYARAGGIASRITGLADTLAKAGHETHLWFVGDPEARGEQADGGLHLHRWCQWISRFHAGGVYDGEEAKERDFAASLPPFLLEHHLRRHLSDGGRAVVLAEEWHTVHAVLHLGWLLRREGLRERIQILWNANNLFGFERIDWAALAAASTITTVSRYMKHRMWPLGVDAIVIPNGLSAEAYEPPDLAAVRELRRRLGTRPVLTKMARWDPDKRWLLAVDTVAELKRQGLRPLLLARGGVEAHGHEVMARAVAAGLHVVERPLEGSGASGLVRSLSDLDGVDVVSIRSHIDAEARRVLFRGASAVLANSGHEPFGLVGLEAMAAGGLACTGCSGEDYALAGRNAVVLQTNDPNEFVGTYKRLRSNPAEEQSIRHAGSRTSRQFAWGDVIERSILPWVERNVSISLRAA